MEEYNIEYLKGKHKDVIDNPAIKEVLLPTYNNQYKKEINIEESVKNAKSNSKSNLGFLINKTQNLQ